MIAMTMSRFHVSFLAAMQLLACARGSASEPVAAEPEATPTVTPKSASAGFVIYTAEQSAVVSLDGSRPAIGEGLWVQDDRSSPSSYSHALLMSEARARKLRLPNCRSSSKATCTSESVERRRFEPGMDTVILEGRACECIEKPIESDGASDECETDGAAEVVALLAGRIWFMGWEQSVCDGMNIYDGTSWSHDLIPDAPIPDDTGMQKLGCSRDIFVQGGETRWPFELDDYGPDECDFESKGFLLRRGELYLIEENVHHAGGERTLSKRVATPTTCPSVDDPCGDAEPFAQRANLSVPTREFWIASDGSAALVGEATSWELWVAGQDQPLRFELPGFDATATVIGVRAHRDVSGLRDLIEQNRAIGRRR